MLLGGLLVRMLKGQQVGVERDCLSKANMGVKRGKGHAYSQLIN